MRRGYEQEEIEMCRWTEKK
jgi:hypothetical protein